MQALRPRSERIAARVVTGPVGHLACGLADWAALLCAMAFMLAAFGQIPINDYMIGRLAEGEWRARIYGEFADRILNTFSVNRWDRVELLVDTLGFLIS